jgi:hypothetical protein
MLRLAAREMKVRGTEVCVGDAAEESARATVAAVSDGVEVEERVRRPMSSQRHAE